MDLPTFSSVDPKLWGRPFWEFLDCIVATFPKDNPSIEHRNAVYDVLQSLRILLPCPTCRKHYCDFLQRHQPLEQVLLSRRSFIEFYYNLKKDVSERVKKNMIVKNPDDMWKTITRRLRLVKPPAHPAANHDTKTLFRTPRVNNVMISKMPKSGCNCGK